MDFSQTNRSGKRPVTVQDVPSFFMNRAATGGEIKLENNILVCPHCESIYLHHKRIDVFERHEDAKTGLHVAVADMATHADMNMVGNPSSRRDGLSIQFWCEGCDATPCLNVYQHKGNTYVEWAMNQE